MLDYNELLPFWAERLSDGNYMEVGAQLCTRDGRSFGNAKVIGLGIIPVVQIPIAIIRTEAGNEVKLTEKELSHYFYEPRYIIKEF